ncbi:MAG: hypothetical protein KKB24_04820 [Candidatus Altiarchaeota archaeon]|nr:hypothetical protein [Candidatus Altiarchaeota archaeon]
MTWHAIDSVEPAWNRTVGLLFKPFRGRFWLKLALVAFLMGLGGGGGGGGGNVGNIDGRGSLGSFSEQIIAKVMENIGIIAVAGGVIILIALALSYIRVVMRFVFLESVLNSKVEIVAGFKRHMGKGFRVFLFELVVSIVLLLSIIAPLLAYYLVFGFDLGAPLWLSLIVGILALLLLVIFTTIITSFTKSFVVPYMYKGRGLVEGWKHLLSVLRKNVTQTLVYVFMSIILKIVSAIAGLIALVIVMLVLAIPGAIIGLLLVMIGGGIALSGVCSGPTLLLCAGAGIVALIPVVLVISYLITLVMLPIPVFFRYYSLVFLTRIDRGFKIPELRS